MVPDLTFQQAVLLQIPSRRDNYIYLLRDETTQTTAVVDPSDAAPVLEALQERGWGLDMILCTHHHNDHVGGNLELKEATDCIVVGYDHDAARIPGIDCRMEEGERVTVGRFEGKVMFVPGHTLGHVAYHFPALKLVFCGDTLFSLGCGRLFEGTAGQMLASLRRLAALPGETSVCCAHEYTQENGRFALTVEPENPDLRQRISEVAQLRAEGKATVPVLLAQEVKTNPFLRPHSTEIRQHLALEAGRDIDVFAELRRRKDQFS